MTAIIIPRRHYTQPQGRVELAPEWAAGYTRGWTESGVLDVASAGEYVSTEYGVALRNTASGSGHVISKTYDPLWDWRGLMSYTVVTLFRIYSTPGPGDHPIVGSTTLTNHWNLYIRYNGSSGFSIRNSSLTSSSDYLIQAGDYVVCVSSRSGSGLSQVSYFSLSHPQDAQHREGSNTADFYLRTANPMRLAGYATSAAPLDILMFGMSRREWDHADLMQNPWQVFRADPIRIYSLPSGAISINSITASNITQTGATITLGLTR